MRKTTILGFAAALVLSTTAAFATPSLSGSYSVSEQYDNSHGGPSITDRLSSPFSTALTPNVETEPVKFFMASPAGSCSGSGCNSDTQTETDTLTVSFSNLSVMGVSIPTLTATATYTAKYSGSELSCAVNDGVSPATGATDCIVWSGAANVWNGSTSLSYDLGNGQSLIIFLYNATDWNITPQIGFELDPVAVPEPASLALFGAAFGVAGLVRRRRAA